MDLAKQMLEEETCGAYTKKTNSYCEKEPVLNPYTNRKIRCEQHGGLSSGPRTPEGKSITLFSPLGITKVELPSYEDMMKDEQIK